MSSLATAPRGARAGRVHAGVPTSLLRAQVTSDAALALVLATGLVLIAFLASGGVELAPNTWVEILLLALCTLLTGAVLLLRASAPVWGAAALALFAALAVLTFASIGWSVQPATSWVEANRTLSYLAAFGTGVALARLVPGRWRALVSAVGVAATVVSVYALLVKVFPGTFDRVDPLGRLHAPFDYWNATGLMAALGMPPCVWLGSRRDGNSTARALTVPALGVLFAVVLLSYSRSALLAMVAGLAVWFAVTPVRLRSALVLGLGLAGGAAIAVWAIATHPITHDRATLAERTSAGHAFGLVLLLVLCVLSAAGLAATFAMDRFTLTRQLRRRIGTVLVTLVTLVPVAGLAALAASSRGFTGEVSHIATTLTSPNTRISDNPGRLVELANSRPRYWNEGIKVGEHSLLAGVGALGYATARTRYTTDPWQVQHAHSYVIETFADFGLIGLALSGALLVAWLAAALRPLRSDVQRLSPRQSDERVGLVALLGVVVAFGAQSLIDWTWFIPATAITALVCAGWLAGRGPLAESPGPVTEAAAAPQRRTRLRNSPGRAAVLVAGTALFLASAWIVWQPLRSSDEYASAIAAMTRGDTRDALAQGRAAAASDPVSLDPHWELSAVYESMGNLVAARAELLKAVSIQPQNPASWEQLAAFYLAQHQPRAALHALAAAQRLDLSSAQIGAMIAQARAASSS